MKSIRLAVALLVLCAAPAFAQVTTWQANQSYVNQINSQIASLQTQISAGVFPLTVNANANDFSIYNLAGLTANSDTVAQHSLKHFSVNSVINANDPKYGMVADMRKGGDGVTNATKTFTSATAAFTQADVGKTLVVYGASGFADGTTITAVTNGTTVTVSNTAGGSASSLAWYLGTNNQAAFLAAWNAANPNGLATSCINIEPGAYLVSYTGTGDILPLNIVTTGNSLSLGGVAGACIFGGGGRGSTFNSGAQGTTAIYLAGNAAKNGFDFIGNYNDLVYGINVEECIGATGPVFEAAWGKTTTADGDVHFLMDDNFVTRTPAATYVLGLYGAENFTVLESEFDALSGGYGVALSGVNSIGMASSGQTLHSTPVSMTGVDFLDINSTIDTNGGTSTPAYGVVIDDGTSNDIARETFNNYFKCNGKEDICLTDTGSGSTEIYYDIQINGRFELTHSGTNTEQAIALAGSLNGGNITAQIGEATASSSALIAAANATMMPNFSTVGPTSGTCFSLTSAAGSHLHANTGCTVTVTDNDEAEYGTDVIHETVLGANTINFWGSSSGHAVLSVPSAAGTPTLTLPATSGAVGQVAESDAGAGTGQTWGNMLTMWGGASATITSSSTDYIAFGQNAAQAVISAQANAQSIAPMSGTAYNLRCFGTTAAQAGGVVYTVYDGSTGEGLACTMNNVNTVACSDTTDTFAVAAGDLLSIKVVNSNAANATGVTGCSFVIH